MPGEWEADLVLFLDGALRNLYVEDLDVSAAHVLHLTGLKLGLGPRLDVGFDGSLAVGFVGTGELDRSSFA